MFLFFGRRRELDFIGVGVVVSVAFRSCCFECLADKALIRFAQRRIVDLRSGLPAFVFLIAPQVECDRRVAALVEPDLLGGILGFAGQRERERAVAVNLGCAAAGVFDTRVVVSDGEVVALLAAGQRAAFVYGNLTGRLGRFITRVFWILPQVVDEFMDCAVFVALIPRQAGDGDLTVFLIVLDFVLSNKIYIRYCFPGSCRQREIIFQQFLDLIQCRLFVAVVQVEREGEVCGLGVFPLAIFRVIIAIARHLFRLFERPFDNVGIHGFPCILVFIQTMYLFG